LLFIIPIYNSYGYYEKELWKCNDVGSNILRIKVGELKICIQLAVIKI